MKNFRIKAAIFIFILILLGAAVLTGAGLYRSEISILSDFLAKKGLNGSRKVIIELAEKRPDPASSDLFIKLRMINAEAPGETEELEFTTVPQRAILQINTLAFQTDSLPAMSDPLEKNINIPFIYKAYISYNGKYKICELAPSRRVPFLYQHNRVLSFVQRHYWGRLWEHFFRDSSTVFTASHNARIELLLDKLYEGDVFTVEISPSGRMSLEYPFVSNIQQNAQKQ